MKHVNFGSKSLLTGADAADLLGRYAALLGKIRSADYIELECIDPLGNRSTVGFLLNGGANLVIESADAALDEPDNRGVVDYMRKQLNAFEAVPINYRWPAVDELDEDEAAEQA